MMQRGDDKASVQTRIAEPLRQPSNRRFGQSSHASSILRPSLRFVAKRGAGARAVASTVPVHGPGLCAVCRAATCCRPDSSQSTPTSHRRCATYTSPAALGMCTRQVAHLQGFGVVMLPERRDAEDPFILASASKSFTALRHADGGRERGFDAPMTTYLRPSAWEMIGIGPHTCATCSPHERSARARIRAQLSNE